MKRLPTNPFKANIVPLTLGSHSLEIAVTLHINEQIWMPRTITKPMSKHRPTLSQPLSKVFYKS